MGSRPLPEGPIGALAGDLPGGLSSCMCELENYLTTVFMDFLHKPFQARYHFIRMNSDLIEKGFAQLINIEMTGDNETYSPFCKVEYSFSMSSLTSPFSFAMPSNVAERTKRFGSSRLPIFIGEKSCDIVGIPRCLCRAFGNYFQPRLCQSRPSFRSFPEGACLAKFIESCQHVHEVLPTMGDPIRVQAFAKKPA